jgi:hypothetical protein
MPQALSKHNLLSTVSHSDHLNLKGVPLWKQSKKVFEFLDLEKNDVSKIAKVAKKSIRYDERIPIELIKRAQEIKEVIELIANSLNGDIEKTATWFRMPNPFLGNISPKDMIRAGRFKKLVAHIHAVINENMP